jgi:anti-sigma factor RsiW
MHEDMRPLLNVYLDGELQGLRLRQLESHLATCADCRNELNDLRRVSELLKAAPLPETLPVERFVANLTLTLPRRRLEDRPSKPGSLLWWLVPVGLLGGWFFLRTTFAILDAAALANASGLFGQASAWFHSSGQQAAWVTVIRLIAGGEMSAGGQSLLNLLNTANNIGGELFSGFLWQAAIALVYMGWLAAWWIRRRPQPIKATVRT